ncbi:DUF2264 domain-containing protein [Streptomyces sp. NBC_01023]|uniref:DUF2264 domain-containing protein n=1 Tax=Streptomyces sp. NBC_01023 TaxID=2903724 RepID=UPI003862F00C|nr:DUF2264 domain-containing protein [Streptomyces sp. NBC_01023]
MLSPNLSSRPGPHGRPSPSAQPVPSGRPARSAQPDPGWPVPSSLLSPCTGWTRADWEGAADELLLAVRPYASPRHGLINLPGHRPSWSGPRSDGLEGYARTWLLAAFRVAGAEGDDPHGFLPRYAEGLAAGTSPSPEGAGHDAADRWPRMADTPQAVVESASVAIGLRLTRPWLWDTLDGRTQQQAVDWLLPALGPSPVNNNWWLFGLTVAGFLQDAGIETDRARQTIDRALERIEEWWLGDGWYSDGPNRSFDHYNAWAMHFYPVLHAHLGGDEELLARYGPRLHDHLDAYTRMFGADGAPMPYGRSLSYRFAAAAAPWLGAMTGYTPLTPGATRRLASGTLRYFLDRDAAPQPSPAPAAPVDPTAPIVPVVPVAPVAPVAPVDSVVPSPLARRRATDERGLLTLGWHGPYEPIIQPYSGPASPYWASKGFLGLLMPAGHPVWTATEERLPAETADAVTVLGPPAMLIQSTAADGLVRLHNHGSNHVGEDDDPGYSRYAYSTRTGFTSPVSTGTDMGHPAGSASAAAPAPAPAAVPAPAPATPTAATVPNAPAGSQVSPCDNHFALVIDGDSTSRGPATPLAAGPGWVASVTTPLPGVRIVSATVVHGRAELRVHLVVGADAGTSVRQTGWAIATTSTSSAAATTTTTATTAATGTETTTGTTGEAAPQSALTPPAPAEPAAAHLLAHASAHAPAHLTAQLHPVHGYTGVTRQLAAGSTLFGPSSQILALDGVITAPESLFVSLASLTAEPDPAPAAALANVHVSDPRTIHVTWQDGTTAVLQLPQLP